MPADGDLKPAAVVDSSKKDVKKDTTKDVSITENEASKAAVKKKSKFRRIKGLLTGESRREKKARKAAEQAATGGGTDPEPDKDDDKSVYGIDIDEMSTAVSMARGATEAGPSLLGGVEEYHEDRELAFLSPNAKSPPLQIILLLMDPNSRRFELLQLEFDSNKALVSDVLTQIPLSVTEEQLRRQQYEGVCDRSGMEMIKTMRLSEFCQTNEVVLAIPHGMSSRECARLARPILSDEGVISMLRASGINTELMHIDPFDAGEVTTSEDGKGSKGSSSGKNFMFVLIAAIAILVGSFQVYITSPLQPGQVLSPGMWMSKCGILSALPMICEKNSGLEMEDNGVLTLYGHDGSVQWRIAGGTCRPESDCVPGLVVKDDGNLVIGGKSITSVTIKGDAPLSPWPFVREPKLRVVRK